MTLSLPMLKHCFPGPRVRDSGGTRTRTRSGRVVPVSGLAGAVGDRPRRPLQVAAPAARPQGATAPRAGTAPLCWRWAAGAGGPSGTEGVPVVEPQLVSPRGLPSRCVLSLRGQSSGAGSRFSSLSSPRGAAAFRKYSADLGQR